MIHQYNKISEVPYHETSPFITPDAMEKVQRNIVKKYKGDVQVDGVSKPVFDGDGNFFGSTRFVRQIECDKQKFIKLYMDNFKAFFGLPDSSIRVFGYIAIDCLKPNKNTFLFIMNDALKYTGYSTPKAIYAGLLGLVNNGIITKGPKGSNLWFMDTDLFYLYFNGDKVSFVKTIINTGE